MASDDTAFMSLVAGYLEGDLTAAERETLKQRIESDVALRDVFLRELELHESMKIACRELPKGQRRERTEFAESIIRARDLPAPMKVTVNSAAGRLKNIRRLFKSRWIFPIAACALVAVGLMSLSLRPDTTDVDTRMGHVVYVEDSGSTNAARPVLVSFNGTEKTLAQDMIIHAGDSIQTLRARAGASGERANAKAAISLDDGATIDLAADTKLKFVARESLELVAGRIYAAASASVVRIKTAYAEVESANASFDLLAGSADAQLAVDKGSVTFKNEAGQVQLTQWQQSSAKARSLPSAPSNVDLNSFWRGRKPFKFGENLFADPGFEGDGKAWIDGWKWSDRPTQSRYAIVKGTAHSGDHSLEMECVDTEYNVRQEVFVTAGVQYEIAAWIKTKLKSDTLEVVVRVFWLSYELNPKTEKMEYRWIGNPITVASVEGEQDWTWGGRILKAPPGAVKARVQLNLNCNQKAGNAWFDDCVIRPVME